jgi:hypothetical protein
VATQDAKWYVIYDNQKSDARSYKNSKEDFSRIYELTFSPDSKHFTYIVNQDKKYYVIYDGQKSEGYDDVKFLLDFE